ncbi:MAG: hypothetical protein MAG458_01033 [Nitrosopumilus sp.]|nr:hypothetical protein [Nitrosopumilus sp.]
MVDEKIWKVEEMESIIHEDEINRDNDDKDDESTEN